MDTLAHANFRVARPAGDRIPPGIGTPFRWLLLLLLVGPVCLAAVRVVSAIPGNVPFPARDNGAFAAVSGPPPAGIEAAAVYVFDATAKSELYSLNPDERRAPASLTKIATAVVVLEHADLDHTVAIEAADVVDSSQSRVELVPGDSLSVHDLLRGLLIQSGNDAALALARHVGGGLPPNSAAPDDPIAAFVAEMNRLAADLGLTNTRFANPTGLDDDEQYSTARDIALLTARALRDPTFAEIVATATATLRSSVRSEGYSVFTTNDLLLDGVVHGVKTGSTSKAGGCLVTVTGIGENQIVSVVLGSPITYDDNGFPHSPARFDAVRTILAAIPNDYQWVDPSKPGLVDGLAEELAVWDAALPPGPRIVVPTGRAGELRYRLQLGPPGKPNQEIGKVLFFVGSDILSERPVLQAASPGGSGSAALNGDITGSP